jgi:hypothetical protein
LSPKSGDTARMNLVKSFFKKILLFVFVGGLIYVLIDYYSYIFSRTVVGRIDNVARVTGVTAMIGGSRTLTESQLHMFSVSIRQPNGEMVTATSEDGQWAIAKAGLCVKAKYYPHPPWNLKQAGTYFNARLLSLADCTSIAAQEMGIDSNAYSGVPLQPVVPDFSAAEKKEADLESGPMMAPESPVNEVPAPPPSMKKAH